ncbi:DnaJ domain-containing protein [Pseudenhygromyxa sp. WMMC2535]|uniref:DnaJ domain-containing protein n=1 Tax=Pseudenhygromyxa sp. WMMC2535 TaxID=2712867 RepID=UPI001555EC28|nr:DnaJ domain-containing protein [Pseudenhygromyxa sp. WMMC2535]
MSSALFVDYYELLEVDPRASSQEIKAAYRACMVRDHADQNPGDQQAQERMILLTRAKQVLLDEHQRLVYDRQRSRWHAISAFGTAPPRWTGGRAPDTPFESSPHRVEVDLRDVSLTKLIVGVGVAAMVGGLSFAARTMADRASRRRRRRW